MNVAEEIFKVFEGMTIEEITNFLVKEKCYGIVKNGTTCPLAQYARKQGCFDLGICRSSIYLSKDHVSYSVFTPCNLSDFIDLFDEGKIPQLIK